LLLPFAGAVAMPPPVGHVGAKENRFVADGQRKSLSRAQMARCEWAYFRRVFGTTRRTQNNGAEHAKNSCAGRI
jgi:hypothetical protein